MGGLARRCLLLSLGSALLPGFAGAQDAPAQRLTGGSSRAWTLHRIVRPPVAGSACSSGEVYTFAVTQELTVNRCRDGRLVESRHAWSISGADADEPKLTIAGMGSYVLSFHLSGAGGSVMRLRAPGAQPGVAMELSLDED